MAGDDQALDYGQDGDQVADMSVPKDQQPVLTHSMSAPGGTTVHVETGSNPDTQGGRHDGSYNRGISGRTGRG